MPADNSYDRMRLFDREGNSKQTSPVITPEQTGTEDRPLREMHALAGRVGGSPVRTGADVPIPIGDLANPYPLPDISDMDADGTDLVDSAAAATIWDATAGEVPQGELGGPPGSLTGYPLPIGDLASPYALPAITDMDADGNDLVDGATTVWDTGAGHVPVGQQQAGYGASSELVLLGAAGSGTGTPSTTSTTYTAVLSNNHTGVVPADLAQRTGISDYAVSGVMAVGNDTAGETTYARVIDETNGVALSTTEVTHTGTGTSSHHTPVVTYNPAGAFEFNVQLKVTAGAGVVEKNPTALLWGVRA